VVWEHGDVQADRRIGHKFPAIVQRTTIIPLHPPVVLWLVIFTQDFASRRRLAKIKTGVEGQLIACRQSDVVVQRSCMHLLLSFRCVAVLSGFRVRDSVHVERAMTRECDHDRSDSLACS
jgi:hypothetical protein